jgi:hypothetical protein
MQSRTESYRRYGIHHGTAMFFDASKPDVDRFLKYMENLIDVEPFEAYMDGFTEGKLGEHKRDHRHLRGLQKKGSEV